MHWLSAGTPLPHAAPLLAVGHLPARCPRRMVSSPTPRCPRRMVSPPTPRCPRRMVSPPTPRCRCLKPQTQAIHRPSHPSPAACRSLPQRNLHMESNHGRLLGRRLRTTETTRRRRLRVPVWRGSSPRSSFFCRVFWFSVRAGAGVHHSHVRTSRCTEWVRAVL